jgi:hypothetical protein
MNSRLDRLVLLAVAVTFTAAAPVLAQTTRASKPDVAVKAVVEEKEKLIQATVTLDGKPLEGVTVSFSVSRTFGNLAIGQDKTLDDGTAAVPFPVGLPAGSTGKLQVLVAITSPLQYSEGRGEATVEGGQAVQASAQAFPRALWAPRAPILLVAVIALILVSVWGCYAYVAAQILAISRKR